MKIRRFVSLIIIVFFTITVFVLIYPKMREGYTLCRIFLTEGGTRYSLIIDLKNSKLLYLIPDDIYVDYLLESAVPSLKGPEGNEFDLDKPNPCEWFYKRDWEALDRNRKRIWLILMERLKEFDNSAALILGYLKVKEALPLLRRAFIKDDYFYGWEGSEISDERNYIHHYCYEEAIEYITGMPIEKYIKLTTSELKDLRRRKARGEEAAAYVLYRLAGEPWDKSVSGRGKIAVLK